MTKPKAIVFDSDEILLDWVTGFVNWHNVTYGTDVNPQSDYHDKLQNLFDIDYDIIDARMQEFNNTSTQFGELKAVDGAEETLYHFARRNGALRYPFDLFVITKSGATADGSRLRRANLVNVFGDIFKHIYCLDIHETKVPYMQEIQRDYDVVLFFDDYFKNCEQITKECGVRSVALTCTHNKHITSDIERVDTWVDGFWPILKAAMVDDNI